jgi:hypothetical protein
VTGKELVVVLGGAVAFGGAAGAAGAALSRGDAPPAAAPAARGDATLEGRLAALEERLRDAEARRDELAGEVRTLRERPVPMAPFPAPRGDAGETAGFLAPTETLDRAIEWEGADLEGGKLEARIREALAAAGKSGLDAESTALEARRLATAAEIEATREATRTLAEDLRGVAAGFGLRALPEAERWDKAKQELGLTDSQVSDLKDASAARAKAIDDAFVTTKSEEDGRGSSFVLRTLDRTKADAAEADWAAKRDAILGEDQRRDWKGMGYDHAFGGPAAGFRVGVAAIEIKAKAPSGDER